MKYLNSLLFIAVVAAGLDFDRRYSAIVASTRTSDPLLERHMPSRYLICFLLAVPTALAKDDFEAEYKKAEGTWSITSQENDGEGVLAEILKPVRAVMKGNTFTLFDGEKELFSGTYNITESKGKILKYDFTVSSGPDKGVTIHLLAEWIDDDTYKTCARQDRKERPLEFSSKKGSGQIVAVYARVKKQK